MLVQNADRRRGAGPDAGGGPAARWSPRRPSPSRWRWRGLVQHRSGVHDGGRLHPGPVSATPTGVRWASPPRTRSCSGRWSSTTSGCASSSSTATRSTPWPRSSPPWGLDHPAQLERTTSLRRVSQYEVRTFGEIHPTLPSGRCWRVAPERWWSQRMWDSVGTLLTPGGPPSTGNRLMGAGQFPGVVVAGGRWGGMWATSSVAAGVIVAGVAGVACGYKFGGGWRCCSWWSLGWRVGYKFGGGWRCCWWSLGWRVGYKFGGVGPAGVASKRPGRRRRRGAPIVATSSTIGRAARPRRRW